MLVLRRLIISGIALVMGSTASPRFQVTDEVLYKGLFVMYELKEPDWFGVEMIKAPYFNI